MLANHFSEYINNQLSKNILVLLVLVMFCSSIYIYKDTKTFGQKELLSRISILEKQADDLKDELYNNEKALKIFKQRQINLKDIKGIEPDQVIKVINYLSTKHNIKHINFYLLNPVLRQESAEYKHSYILYQQGIIELIARNDADIYNFLSDIQANVKGYFQPISLTVDKTKLTSSEIIISSGNLFKGKIKFVWQSILLKDDGF